MSYLRYLLIFHGFPVSFIIQWAVCRVLGTATFFFPFPSRTILLGGIFCIGGFPRQVRKHLSYTRYRFVELYSNAVVSKIIMPTQQQAFPSHSRPAHRPARVKRKPNSVKPNLFLDRRLATHRLNRSSWMRHCCRPRHHLCITGHDSCLLFSCGQRLLSHGTWLLLTWLLLSRLLLAGLLARLLGGMSVRVVMYISPDLSLH